ncbi:transcription antitermination factor NusB [Citroniella saccharovorans]|uniref:Transcription antitermination protein NusB n=1 Tax=Citroniella saccharovorans TaxID=2053367 RepID=A0AAW9MR96_9FIRM|nr:transcription antitermination factor NusB [Citroniella saccharovorans]MEB3429591.1 transcription antitermination factor NusB [Citroniella saccharovorans]
MTRKQARELVMKILYEMEIKDEFSTSILEAYSSYKDDSEYSYISSSILSVIKNITFIDELITKNLKGWDKLRISKVDLSILRNSINEIFFMDDIPTSVSINEAVDLAKKYSYEDSYRFVNGLLGTIVKEKSDDF